MQALRRLALILALTQATWLASALATGACDYCNPGIPLHKEFQLCSIVAFGHIARSTPALEAGRGTSELYLEAVLKDQAGALKDRTTVVIHKFLPPNPKVKFLVLAEMIQGQFDPFRSFVFGSDRVLKYLREAPPPPRSGDSAAAQKWLRYHFEYLADPEPEIAKDAFNVWASATNAEVHAAAPGLPPERLRQWLLDPKTPVDRLSLYAHLLGACGSTSDAELLRNLIQHPDERMAACIDGLLGGYIQLQPAEGWKLAQELLADPDRPFTQKHLTLRMLRFYHSATGEQYLKPITQCLGIMLKSASLFDLAVEQLRQWKLWQYTDEILQAFGSEKAKAPMTQRAIVRYALSCTQPAGKEFVSRLKQGDPKTARMVQDVEEDLVLFEEPIKAPPTSPGR
jgi:hypothetical protein